MLASSSGLHPPEITEHPEDAVVVRNEPVTLRCAASEAGSRITWYKDGKRVVTADMDHKVGKPGNHGPQ